MEFGNSEYGGGGITKSGNLGQMMVEIRMGASITPTGVGMVMECIYLFY